MNFSQTPTPAITLIKHDDSTAVGERECAAQQVVRQTAHDQYLSDIAAVDDDACFFVAMGEVIRERVGGNQ